MDTQVEKQETRGKRRDNVIFYHPNAESTGAVMRLQPKTDRDGGLRCECFFMDMAPQKTAPSRTEDGFVPASFDWENRITVKLGFTDICEILAVLADRVERVGGRRDGLYHQSGSMNTIIRFKKHEDGGYIVGLSRRNGGDDDGQRISIVLSEIEAIGVRHVLEAGLFYMSL